MSNHNLYVFMILHRAEGGGIQKSVRDIACALADREISIVYVLHDNTEGALQIDGFPVINVSAISEAGLQAKSVLQYIEDCSIDFESVTFIGHSYGAYKILKKIPSGRCYFCIRQDYSYNLSQGNIFQRLRKKRKYKSFFDGEKLLAVSQGIASNLLEAGIQPAALDVLYNPVCELSLLEQSVSTVNAVLPERFILFVGSLIPRKNPMMLLMASIALLKRNADMGLVFLGEGKERHKLEQVASEAGVLSQLYFEGWVDNPYFYMKRAEVMVLTSNMEGYPRVVLEALKLDVPVIATDCPSGPKEALVGSLADYLIAMNDIPALEVALNKVLSHSYPEITLSPEYNYQHCVERYFRLVTEGKPSLI